MWARLLPVMTIGRAAKRKVSESEAKASEAKTIFRLGIAFSRGMYSSKWDIRRPLVTKSSKYCLASARSMSTLVVNDFFEQT